MNKRPRRMNHLQELLARDVLFRREQGPTHLPTLKELAHRYCATVSAVRAALQPLVTHGLVELRHGRPPWLPPLALRRGIETVGLELAVARTPAERLRPLEGWLEMEHELAVEAFRACCRARPDARQRVVSALDQVIGAAFSYAPAEVLALYRWRAIGAAVDAAGCEALRLLGNTLGRSVEQVLPFVCLAVDAKDIAEECLELQELVLGRSHELAGSLLDLATRRLHARVMEMVRGPVTLRPPRRTQRVRTLKAG